MNPIRNLTLGALMVVLAACSPPSTPEAATEASSTPSTRPARPAAAQQAGGVHATVTLPRVVVHKTPSCGCCTLWVDRMREAGFDVQVRNEDGLGAVKERVGIPFGKGSCHTAEVGGYFVEGHVPPEDIKRLLAERPGAKGLALPGMPAGSPGMEMPDGSSSSYTVELVGVDGRTVPFARH